MSGHVRENRRTQFLYKFPSVSHKSKKGNFQFITPCVFDTIKLYKLEIRFTLTINNYQFTINH